MTERSAHAIEVHCNECGNEYVLEPSRVIGDNAWYSSDREHCQKCESMNLTIYSSIPIKQIKHNVYPSIEELIPSILRSKLPATLIEEITERYETLGEKYLTDEVTEDGRRVNGMCYSDRIVNCREEIVDGVFCILGQILKEQLVEKEPDDRLYELLIALIEIYSSLKFIENEGDYVIALPR